MLQWLVSVCPGDRDRPMGQVLWFSDGSDAVLDVLQVLVHGPRVHPPGRDVIWKPLDTSLWNFAGLRKQCSLAWMGPLYNLNNISWDFGMMKSKLYSPIVADDCGATPVDTCYLLHSGLSQYLGSEPN